MPDEHRTISSSRPSGEEVARHSFEMVRKGFNPSEVRAYLELIGREISGIQERERALRDEIKRFQELAEHPVLDEATLAASLGHHSAQIIRNAHEEAARITALAEEHATLLVREAQQEATELQVRTEESVAQRVADAELSVSALHQRANEEIEHHYGVARAEAEDILNQAREQGRAIVQQSHDARKEILGDLARRRRSLSIQIEQFRAARDELSATVHGVRTSVETILADLDGADDNARQAAANAVIRELPGAGEGVGAGGGVGAGEGVGAGAENSGADSSVGTRPQESDTSLSVDELFARIRASQSIQSQNPPEDGVLAEVKAEGDSEAGGVKAEDDSEVGEVKAEDDSEAGEYSDEPLNVEEINLERSRLIDPITASLISKVKRVLQDDQNQLLDAIRGNGGSWSDDLLRSEEDHFALYYGCVIELVKEAFVAGADSIVSAALQGEDQTSTSLSVKDKHTPDSDVLNLLAKEFSREIVGSLRGRILVHGSEGLSAKPADRISAAFRETRGDRLDRMVEDCLLGAFSSGILNAVEPGSSISWLLTSANACPDCEDNTLEGQLVVGDTFPTGHQYPPAHAGCRCIIWPRIR